MTCMCHVPFLPTLKGWLSSWNRMFNAVDSIDNPVDISQHIRIGINVWVFKANVSIERPHLSDGKRLDDKTILHPSFRILYLKGYEQP